MQDGATWADGALIYVMVIDGDGQGSGGQSSMLSSLVESGYWNVQLADARLLDFRKIFDYSASEDLLQTSVYASDGTTAATLVDTGNDSPAPTLET